MSIIGTFPSTITNGQVEDATVVMSLFSWIQAQTNGNACPATIGALMLKGDGLGGTTAAVADTDYTLPATVAAPSGASLVGYMPDGVGAVATTVEAVLRESVSITRFGASPSASVTANNAAFASAQAYALAQTYPVEIVIPAGKYSYSVSPNWAINNLSITCKGLVIFEYSGVGDAFICDADVFGSGGGRNGISIGRIVIYAPSTAGCGALIRSIHHSQFELTVKGCGNGVYGTAIGINVLGCVCTTFTKPVVNKYDIFNGWYSATAPNVGMYFGSSVSYGHASACLVINPIMEFTLSFGIHIAAADGIRILGGTCEETYGYGLAIEYGSNGNVIDGVDFEENTTAGLLIGGAANSIINCMALGIAGNATSGLFVLNNGATQNKITNCSFDKLTIIAGATYNVIDNCTVNTTNSASIWLTDAASGRNYIGKCIDLAYGNIGIPYARIGFVLSSSSITIANTTLNPLVIYLVTQVLSMSLYDPSGAGYSAPVGSQIILYPNGSKVTLNLSVSTGTLYGNYYS